MSERGREQLTGGTGRQRGLVGSDWVLEGEAARRGTDTQDLVSSGRGRGKTEGQVARGPGPDEQ
jgi:hypothetical protein